MKLWARFVCWLILWGSVVSTSPLLGEEFSLPTLIQQRVDWGYHAGVAIATLSEQGVVYCSAGYLDQTQTQYVDEHVLFEIASLTKVFTSYLLLFLEQEQGIDLDQPVTHYLPQVRLPTFEGEAITVRHLATHTSGLQDPQLEYFNPKTGNRNPEADYTIEDLYAYLSELSLSQRPGTQYLYSNVGYGLLGHLLEMRTGKSLQTLFDEFIFKPLGMADTFFSVPAEKRLRCAQGYRDGQVTASWRINALHGFAGLTSTAADVAKFLNLFLSKETTPHTKAAQALLKPYFKQGTKGVALGWHIDEAFDVPIYFAYGGSLGFSAFMGVNPQQRRAIVILTNHASLDNIGMHWLCPKYALRELACPVDLAESILEKYEGIYSDGESLSVTIERQGNHLVLSDCVEPPLHLYAKTETQFFPKFLAMTTSVEFIFDANSKQYWLKVSEAGGESVLLKKTSSKSGTTSPP